MPRLLLLSLLLAAGAARAAFAQPPNSKTTAAAPCCGITAIDVATGVVTAQEASTGHVFRFEVRDRVVLRGLKVGQKVFADFVTGKVSVGVDPASPCCGILGTRVDTRPDAASPCCGITAIDAAAKLVTARIRVNGSTFRFRVNDAALLGSLKLGQDVWASKAAGKAGVKAGELCCPIISPSPKALP